MSDSKNETVLAIVFITLLLIGGIVLAIWNDIKNFAHLINADPWSIVIAITAIIITIIYTIIFRGFDAYISKLIPLMAVLYAVWNVLVSIKKITPHCFMEDLY